MPFKLMASFKSLTLQPNLVARFKILLWYGGKVCEVSHSNRRATPTNWLASTIFNVVNQFKEISSSQHPPELLLFMFIFPIFLQYCWSSLKWALFCSNSNEITLFGIFISTLFFHLWDNLYLYIVENYINTKAISSVLRVSTRSGFGLKLGTGTGVPRFLVLEN
jgi:hypothetical protein